MGMFDLGLDNERERKRRSTRDYYSKSYGTNNNPNSPPSVKSRSFLRRKGKKVLKAYQTRTFKSFVRPQVKLGKPKQFRKSYEPKTSYSTYFEMGDSYYP